MGAARGIARPFRRGLVTMAVVAVAAAGLVGIAAAPAGADSAFGYTIEVQVPQGLGRAELPCRLAKVDLATGAITGIGSYLPPESLACANDLAFSPSGVLYGISNGVEEDNEEEQPIAPDGFGAADTFFNETVHLVRFDTTTGAVTDLGLIGTGPAFIGSFERPGGGLTFDAAGNLWVMMVGVTDACDDQAYCFYKVDPTTPTNATFAGAGPGETYMFGLTANCAGEVFTTEQNFGDDASAESDVLVALGGHYLRSVNTATGATARVGVAFGGNNLMQSLDFSADGVLYGLGSTFASEHKGFLDTGFLYTINKGTGAATKGAQLSAPQFGFAQALAIAPLNCPAPPPAVIPLFTG